MAFSLQLEVIQMLFESHESFNQSENNKMNFPKFFSVILLEMVVLWYAFTSHRDNYRNVWTPSNFEYWRFIQPHQSEYFSTWSEFTAILMWNNVGWNLKWLMLFLVSAFYVGVLIECEFYCLWISIWKRETVALSFRIILL